MPRSSTSARSSCAPWAGARPAIYEFGLAFDEDLSDEDLETIQDGFTAAWAGERDSDDLDRLLLKGIAWQRVSIVQSFAKYLRQAGFTYSDASLAHAFTSNPALTAKIVEAFEVKFDRIVSSRRSTSARRRQTHSSPTSRRASRRSPPSKPIASCGPPSTSSAPSRGPTHS